MALIRLIDERSAPLLVRDLFGDDDPGPIVGALAQVPELCQVALPFLGTSLGPSGVSLRHKEIAILRTSANFSCRYCIDAHTVVARDSGLTDSEVRALRESPAPKERFDDPVEQALLEWIDALSLGRGPVPSAVAEHARDVLGDHRLVDITVTVGTTMLLNRFASGLGLPTSADTTGRLAEFGFESFQPPAPVTIGGAR